jgi:2-oxoglutarate ferredoxin oxidoreductase subunit gamma
MEQSVIIAGFGGQGVILAGKILAQAGMDHGLGVTWLPSYGPEMRGGTANCTVVLSEEGEVGSPIVDEPTALVAMNLPSLEKFEPTVAEGGTIIVNSSLIDREVERADVSAFSIRLNDLGKKAGSLRAINMVALGAYVKATGIIPLAAVKAAMREMLENSGKEKFIPLNEQALEEGYNAV